MAVFRELLANDAPDEAQRKDVDFLLAGGELFALVVYGQLILETARIYQVEDTLIDQIFDALVGDFSKFALALYGKPSSTKAQMDFFLRMLRKSAVDEVRTRRVWDEVYALRDAYEMAP